MLKLLLLAALLLFLKTRGNAERFDECKGEIKEELDEEKQEEESENGESVREGLLTLIKDC